MQNNSLESVKCHLCSTSFRTNSELDEHEWSLLHHIKLEKSTVQCQHVCTLCQLNCTSLADFSKHLESFLHQSNLTLYNEKKRGNSYNESRREHSYQPTLWSTNNFDWSTSTCFNSFCNNGVSCDGQQPGESRCGTEHRPSRPGGFRSQPLLPTPRDKNNSASMYSYKKDWKKQRHSDKSRKPPFSPHSRNRRTFISSTNAYFEPDIPINVKHMPELGGSRHSFTVTSNRLNHKFKDELKRQKISEKARSYGKRSTPFYDSVELKKTSQHSTLVEKTTDKKSKSSKSDTSVVEKQRDKMSKNVKRKKRRDKNSINSTTTDAENAETKITEADSTTSFVEVDTGLSEFAAHPSSTESVKVDRIASGNIPFPTKPNFLSTLKKAMRCPAAASSDISKRLLAERIKNYRVQGCSSIGASPERSKSFLSRSLSESSSDVEIVEKLCIGSVTSNNAFSPALRVEENGKRISAIKTALEALPEGGVSLRNVPFPPQQQQPVRDSLASYIVESNKQQTSALVAPNQIVDSVKNPCGTAAAIEETLVRKDSGGLDLGNCGIFNAIEVLKCDSPNDLYPGLSSSLRPDLDLESSTIPEHCFDAATSDAPPAAATSKFQLLWNCCQEEEKVRAEIFSLHQELESLQRRMSICQKRKIEAESEYRRIRVRKQELLASETGSFDRSTANKPAGAIPTSETSCAAPAVQLTYLGMIDTERCLIKNLESALGVTIPDAMSGVYPFAIGQTGTASSSSTPDARSGHGLITAVKQEL